MSERVVIEVEYKLRARIELPEGQDYGDFLDNPEAWEDALVNDLAGPFTDPRVGEFRPYLLGLKIDTNDHTDDPEWMELSE